MSKQLLVKKSALVEDESILRNWFHGEKSIGPVTRKQVARGRRPQEKKTSIVLQDLGENFLRRHRWGKENASQQKDSKNEGETW